MKKIFLFGFLIALFLFIGCAQPPSESQIIYVCEDGTQVSDSLLCPKPEPCPEPEQCPPPVLCPEPEPCPEPEEELVEADLNSYFRIESNKPGFIESENLTIKLVNVTEDSRCSMGVECITEGKIGVLLNISKDNLDLGDLSLTTEEGLKEIDQYSIELITLEPLPLSNQTLLLSDYLVTLIVTKKEPEPEPPAGLESIVYNDLNFNLVVNNWVFLEIFPEDYNYADVTEKINISMRSSKTVYSAIAPNFEDANAYMGVQTHPYVYYFDKIYNFDVGRRINQDFDVQEGWGEWIFFIANYDAASLLDSDLNVRFTYFSSDSNSE